MYEAIEFVETISMSHHKSSLLKQEVEFWEGSGYSQIYRSTLFCYK